MTVIAYDGKNLVADKKCSANGLSSTVTKIYKINDCLVGCAGDVTYCNQLISWFKNGEDKQNFPEMGDVYLGMLVIRPSKEVHYFENNPFPILLEDKFIAIGSGDHFAEGCMYSGKTAIEAVLLTNQHINSCGNGIDVLKVI